MKKPAFYIYTSFVLISLILMFTSFSTEISANDSLKKTQQKVSFNRTTGTLDFQIRTTSHGGQYAPRHAFAIWVCDSNNNFVRTLKRRAWSYQVSLVEWYSMSNGNQEGLITGASLNAHTTHNISWDLTDSDDNELPDGTYKVYTEFTESNSHLSWIDAGPLVMFEFEKGNDTVELYPPDDSNFHDIELIFTPDNPVEPAITITSPEDGALISSLPVNVIFELEDFNPEDGDGLIGVYVNSELSYLHETLNPVQINSLSEGDNEIALRLMSSEGVPFDPIIEDMITVTSTVSSDDPSNQISKYNRFESIYPNPFSSNINSRNNTVSISYSIENPADIIISIYDIKGRIIKEIAKGYQKPGTYTTNLDIKDIAASGIYFSVLKVDNRINDTQKITIMK